MSIENNIHNVGVALGVTQGQMKEDGELKPLSPEWFKKKAEEFTSEEAKAKELYDAFVSNYGPAELSKVNGKDLLKKLFLGAGNDNMCHELEYVSSNNELFGSIRGGNAYKYPLHYDTNSSSWVSGTFKNPKYLNLADAIKIGEAVRKFIIDAEDLISHKKPLDTVEKYIELYAELFSLSPDYVDNMWFSKYLHMICPDTFSTFYNKEWQEKVLNVLEITPSDSSFGRIGQIMKFIKKCDISTVAFNKVFHVYAKEYKEDLNTEINESERIKGGENIILYGVPGAGKSWTIKNEYCNNDNYMERLVFHPDYTYSDFVGQILPKAHEDGTVTYEFTEGPFTKILEKAYSDPSNHYYLIIEEVNRGNAPAIFGDIFQLLDRNKDGASDYEITNGDIARLVYKDENHKVSIPSNMSILCTMNTSDQNVFTLDTAFQRRWSMRLIKNKFNKNESNEEAFANKKILDTDVTWEKFFNEINDLILGKNIRMTSSEDKRLGTHFVNENDLDFDSEVDPNGEMTTKARKQNSRFPEKVLKYLWDDAFKFTKEDIFDIENVKSLEAVIDNFLDKDVKGNNRFKKVFKENIYKLLTDNK